MSNNSVTLLGYYGGDKTHALSAWTSTFNEEKIDLPNNISNRIDVLFNEVKNNRKKSYPELLKFLAENNHHTPFEKSFLHFQVDIDIASHIHILKNRIAVSVNTESARYKELTDKFLVPDDLPFEMKEALIRHSENGNELYHEWKDKLINEHYFSVQRAKESSRYFLGYNKQLVQDISFNFRSFQYFLSLRNSDHAQKEIHDIAAEMLEQVKKIKGNPFKYTLKAFNI